MVGSKGRGGGVVGSEGRGGGGEWWTVKEKGGSGGQ